MSERCPTCGAAVRVVGGEEGTMHYEPLETARIRHGGQLQADPDSSKDLDQERKASLRKNDSIFISSDSSVLGLGEDNKP